MLGFAGLIAEGVDPKAAWEAIRKGALEPSTQAIIDQLRQTDDGRAALAASAARWAELGFDPPWEP